MKTHIRATKTLIFDPTGEEAFTKDQIYIVPYLANNVTDLKNAVIRNNQGQDHTIDEWSIFFKIVN